MERFNDDIAGLARDNTNFRRVMVTGSHSQLVLMSIEPGGEIGEEVHDHVDQVLAFVEGEGEAILDGETFSIRPHTLTFVPAGLRHNFRNTGSAPLKLYTVYAPPQHPPGTVHRTKADADAAEH